MMKKYIACFLSCTILFSTMNSVPAQNLSVVSKEASQEEASQEEISQEAPAQEKLENSTEALLMEELPQEEMQEISILGQGLDNGAEAIQENDSINSMEISADEIVPVIIEFSEEYVLEQNPENMRTENIVKQIQGLLSKQNSQIDVIEDKVLGGDSLEIRYQYTWLLNGIATQVPYGLIPEIKKLDGVKQVLLEETYEVQEEAETSQIGIQENISSSMKDIGDYSGKGTKIAVIDTGIDVDHDAFSNMSQDALTEDSMTEEKLTQLLPCLKASTLYTQANEGQTLSIEDTYYNNKVAFGFNYVDSSTEIVHDNDGRGDHGTRVAGIAAANVTASPFNPNGMSGIARDAQLYVMKVYGHKGGAYSSEVLAAIEDALLLQADVINLSLGVACGFAMDEVAINEIYNRVEETSTILTVAAGNHTVSEGAQGKDGYSTTAFPDNGTIDSPASYEVTTAIASVDEVYGEEEVNYGEKVSDFSSWGVTPELTLKPELAAPGGNVITTMDDGGYGMSSGTSIAAPAVAGMAAVLCQFLKEKYPELSGAEKRQRILAMLMSSAEVLTYENQEELFWSPRAQGAGSANLNNAIEAECFLSVPGQETPKIQLYDDVEHSGTYRYQFEIHNVSDHNKYYEVLTSAQTEAASSSEGSDVYLMSRMPMSLEIQLSQETGDMISTYDYNGDGKFDTSDVRRVLQAAKKGLLDLEKRGAFRYDINKDGSIDKMDATEFLYNAYGMMDSLDFSEQCMQLKPGETRNISVEMTLEDSARNYLDAFYPNGGYVEGYTRLRALDAKEVDLSLPYLAFYGDWTSAPVIGEDEYLLGDWQQESEPAQSILLNMDVQGKKLQWKPGYNPYIAEEAFDYSHVVVSPNKDGYADYLSDMRIPFLRNARRLDISYIDMEKGDLFGYSSFDWIRKSKVDGEQKLFSLAEELGKLGEQTYEFTDSDGKVLPNGTQVYISATAELPYDRHESYNQMDWMGMLFTVDSEKPKVSEATLQKKDGRVFIRLRYTDNVDVAAIYFLYGEDKSQKAIVEAEPVEPGEYTTQLIDITDFGEKFTMVIGDYGFNERAYSLSVGAK